MKLPMRLGGFELTEKLGAGAMGTVYRAVQTSLSREVVIKTLHPHLMEAPDLIARFEREARHAAGLQHPNTVQVIEFGREGDLHYIAMEYVEGMDLKEVLRLLGPFPPEVFVLVMRDICRGMEAAHARDLIHRDLKPANLMISRDGAVKVMDFGLARETAESSTITQHGSVMGSAAYMSPEQAQGLTIDHRTDVFSLGLVGYELASNIRAFPGETYAAVLRAVVFDDVIPLEEVRTGLPRDIYDLINAMTIKDLASRCPSMAAARDDLETLAQKLDLRSGDRILAEFVGRAAAIQAGRSVPPISTQISMAETRAEPPAAGDLASHETALAPQPDAAEADKTRVRGGPTEPKHDPRPSSGAGSGGVPAHSSTGAGSGGAPDQGSDAGGSGGSGPPGPAVTGAGDGGGGSKKVLLALLALVVLLASAGGVWFATQGDSPPIPVSGACCLTDGACVVLIETRCQETGGTWSEVSCEPNPCPEPTGACCLENGNCAELTEEECSDDDGEYLGTNVPCATAECDLPVGACCAEGGACALAESAECRDDGGKYQGDGTVCVPNPCPQPPIRENPPPPPPKFSKEFSISTSPSFAEVRIDNEQINRNEVGNFKATLQEGTHRFHLYREAMGIDRVVTYTVRRNDPNNKLVLMTDTGTVKASP